MEKKIAEEGVAPPQMETEGRCGEKFPGVEDKAADTADEVEGEIDRLPGREGDLVAPVSA
jgi:hypothetical protein